MSVTIKREGNTELLPLAEDYFPFFISAHWRIAPYDAVKKPGSALTVKASDGSAARLSRKEKRASVLCGKEDVSRTRLYFQLCHSPASVTAGNFFLCPRAITNMSHVYKKDQFPRS